MNPKIKRVSQWLGKEISKGFLNYWIATSIASGTLAIAVTFFWHRLCNTALVLWQLPASQWTWKEATIVLDIVLVLFALFFLLGIYFYKKRANREDYHPVPINKDESITLKTEPVNRKSEKEFERELQECRVKLLKNLSGSEKRMLKSYFEKDTKSRMCHVADGGVTGMVGKGILFCPSEYRYGVQAAFNITEWAWEYLKEHPKLLE